jgi:hypothetical protein
MSTNKNTNEGKMITNDKYTPYFYGKDAEQQLNAWNALISERDYESLISKFRTKLCEYIGELRTAQIFKKCAIAEKELDLLNKDLIWFEAQHKVEYVVTCSVTRQCETDEEFYALATEDEYVDLQWVWDQLRLYPCIDNYHPCETRETYPGMVKVGNVFLKTEWDLMKQAQSDT